MHRSVCCDVNLEQYPAVKKKEMAACSNTQFNHGTSSIFLFLRDGRTCACSTSALLNNQGSNQSNKKKTL